MFLVKVPQRSCVESVILKVWYLISGTGMGWEEDTRNEKRVWCVYEMTWLVGLGKWEVSPALAIFLIPLSSKVKMERGGVLSTALGLELIGLVRWGR